uniref:Uncharacterized protein n=1 Tax=Caenorhabditis japonica TaxID=281687 RepID=A0A8R1IC44_CAEJA
TGQCGRPARDGKLTEQQKTPKLVTKRDST